MAALALPVEGLADVVVFDRITTVGTPVFLKVLTKGRFFAEGGRRVQVRVGNQQPQTTLSGGDGLAYLKVKPKREGLFKIEAVSGSDRHSGHLLVIKADADTVIIGVESSLRESLFSVRPKTDSAPAVTKLARHHHILYVTEWLNTDPIKSWLDGEKYPLSIVMRWQADDTLEMLKKQRVSVAAVVGSEAMLKTARRRVQNRYCFEKTRYGTPVSDWNEILENLQITAK